MGNGSILCERDMFLHEQYVSKFPSKHNDEYALRDEGSCAHRISALMVVVNSIVVSRVGMDR